MIKKAATATRMMTRKIAPTRDPIKISLLESSSLFSVVVEFVVVGKDVVVAVVAVTYVVVVSADVIVVQGSVVSVPLVVSVVPGDDVTVSAA